MKKTKLIALTLVVAIMMIGAGYAAWTDTLKMDMNVNTGHLDIHFVDIEDEVTFLEGSDLYMNASASYSQDSEGGQNDWDNALVTVNKAYPGAKFNIKLKMKNNSTMPVKLASLTSDPANYGQWHSVGLGSASLNIQYYDENNNLKTQVYMNPFEPAQWGNDQNTVPINGYMVMNLNFTGGETVDEDTTYALNFTPTFEQFNQ
nr:hypothetical protein [Sedimentibacter sp.]